MLELCASRQKPPSVSVCWLRQHASSQLAPPRATRSASVAWALCAPGEPDLRLALRARRSAHGAARRGHCAPVCRAAPGGAAAGCHRRLALRARRRWRGRCAPGRLRQPGRGLALRARRRWPHGAARLRASRRSRWLPSPPRATRARRRWRGRCAPGRLLQPIALLPRARVGGGVSDIIMHGRVWGTLALLPQHVQSESARRASATEAPYTPRPGRPPAL